MIVGLLLVLQVVGAAARPAGRAPRVTLDQAIARATRLDPELRAGARARWTTPSGGGGPRWRCSSCRRSRASIDATKYSTEFFNIGTGRNQAEAVNATLQAPLRSVQRPGSSPTWAAPAPSSRAPRRASCSSGSAPRCWSSPTTTPCCRTRSSRRVAADRTRRAEEGLGIARARVVSGAAVQSDSLQLVLELTQARTDQLRRDAALTVSRLQLGRRIGEAGPVDAEPLGLAPAARAAARASTEAVQLAARRRGRSTGPRGPASGAASAFLKGERGQYLPQFTLIGDAPAVRRQLLPERAERLVDLAQRVAADLGRRPARDRHLAGAGQPRRVARHPRGPRARRPARRDRRRSRPT